MRFIPTEPVSMAALAALGLGFLLFFLALMSARARSRAFGPNTGGRKAPASLVWIIVQGIGIAIAAFGPIVPTLDPLSAAGLLQALAVSLLMLGAVALFDWSSRTMGRNWALIARTRGDATLVTNGPFAIVRNPIYVALALFMIAMSVAYGHPYNLILAVPVYAVGTWMRVAHEEQVLRETFGQAFDEYAARVKRFVPGVI